MKRSERSQHIGSGRKALAQGLNLPIKAHTRNWQQKTSTWNTFQAAVNAPERNGLIGLIPGEKTIIIIHHGVPEGWRFCIFLLLGVSVPLWLQVNASAAPSYPHE